ncbi:hypothetical protein V6Z69_13305 [Cereibacter sphaeroides]|uniref:hypothetical protein n=1 Tax=Cereibacter sphaeroides TaxID=1063 RepID=UPI0005A15D23|nr:hypothetical protein D1122_02745 [Cereibacter sphaeroides]
MATFERQNRTSAPISGLWISAQQINPRSTASSSDRPSMARLDTVRAAPPASAMTSAAVSAQ